MSDVIQEVTRDDAGIIVRLGGEIDLHESPKFHQGLVDLCDEKPERLILEMSEVDYIDSSGVGSLVAVYRLLAKVGKSLILVAPSKRVSSVLEITRLDKFFCIVGCVDEAKAL